MKKLFLHTLLWFCCSLALAQSSTQQFLTEFYNASDAGKVRLAASKPYESMVGIYPQIIDTLSRIKRDTYWSSKPSRIKYLFDKIDADKQSYYHNYARAIFILQNSLRNHVTNIDDSLRCLAGLKILFIKIKNYSRALELHHLLELNRSRKSDTMNIYFGMSKSTMYNEMGLTNKALAERRKDFLKSNTRDTMLTVSFYNDMGVYFNVLKNSDSAEVYFLKAKYLLNQVKYPPQRENNISFFKALIDGNLGMAYYNCGKIKAAIPLLKKDVYYSLRSNHYESAMNSYLLLVRSQLDQQRNNLAAAYLDSARNLVTTHLHEIKPRLKFILTQADFYSRTGDHYKANENYKDYLALNSKASAIENAQQIDNESITLSVEQREKELSDRDNMIKREQLEDARERSFRAYLIAGILLLLVIMGFLLLNNYNARQREAQLSIKNKQISSQKFQIEQSLKEKDVLIKEIHHRVKNNLQIITSMLSLQIAKVEDEKTESILRDAKQRISSIALTHQMLYQKENLSAVNLGEYIERLVRQVEFIMPASNIALVTEIYSQDTRLSIDNAVPLGLLVNELLTNAYKHAFPEGEKGCITVQLTEHGDAFTLKVSDNGVGLPENFNSIERKTLGMELIYILAEQLDSTLVVENASGSSFMLSVKKSQV